MVGGLLVLRRILFMRCFMSLKMRDGSFPSSTGFSATCFLSSNITLRKDYRFHLAGFMESCKLNRLKPIFPFL